MKKILSYILNKKHLLYVLPTKNIIYDQIIYTIKNYVMFVSDF